MIIYVRIYVQQFKATSEVQGGGCLPSSTLRMLFLANYYGTNSNTNSAHQITVMFVRSLEMEIARKCDDLSDFVWEVRLRKHWGDYIVDR